MTTKRVCDLQIDDVFVYYNVEQRVVGIGDSRIYFKPHHFPSPPQSCSFGIKNKMKVEVTGKRVRKIKQPNGQSVAGRT